MSWLIAFAAVTITIFINLGLAESQVSLQSILPRSVSASFKLDRSKDYGKRNIATVSSNSSSPSHEGERLTEWEVSRRRVLVGGYITLGVTVLGLLFLLVTQIIGKFTYKPGPNPTARTSISQQFTGTLL